MALRADDGVVGIIVVEARSLKEIFAAGHAAIRAAWAISSRRPAASPANTLMPCAHYYRRHMYTGAYRVFRHVMPRDVSNAKKSSIGQEQWSLILPSRSIYGKRHSGGHTGRYRRHATIIYERCCAAAPQMRYMACVTREQI